MTVVLAAFAAEAGSEGMSADAMTLLDFAEELDWIVVNDGVMGGRSSSRFERGEEYGVFTGNVSLENNGGFSTMRSQAQDLDLADFDGLLLRVRGDGTDRRFHVHKEGVRLY